MKKKYAKKDMNKKKKNGQQTNPDNYWKLEDMSINSTIQE